MVKNKVLILGAKGMLGQELVRVFQKDKKYAVFGWDRDEIDITDRKESARKISELKPKIILNAAAYNAVDKCEEDESELKKALAINGKAPGYLATIAKKIDAIFVHYSSDYVFGKKMPEIIEPEGCTHICATCALHKDFIPEIGFREEDEPAPVNKYGKTKLAGEKAVRKAGGKYYLIRLSKLFGAPAKAKTAKRSFFDVMLEIGKKNKTVKVVDEETSCFTYAPDLAKKTKEIIEAKKDFGIYHIVNSDPCTWYEAVEELYMQAKLKKVKIEPVSGSEFARPAQRPYFSVLINTKLNPLRSYKKALAEYLKK